MLLRSAFQVINKDTTKAIIDWNEDMAMTAATLGELMNDNTTRNKPHCVTHGVQCEKMM